jgi:chromosomal replication initiation ATPase DnaA
MTPLELEVGWSPAAFRRPNGAQDARYAAFIIQFVAFYTGVGAGEIASPARHCADAARARQIAMYLAHTGFAWPLARVAAAFGRDRSTASYACKRVEDLRENPRFDSKLAWLERWLHGALTFADGQEVAL